MESTYIEIDEGAEATYQALLKIPKKDLEERFEWICGRISYSAQTNHSRAELREHMQSQYKWRRIATLGLYKKQPELILDDPCTELRKLCMDSWAGTGWNFDAYYKIHQDRSDNLSRFKKQCGKRDLKLNVGSILIATCLSFFIKLVAVSVLWQFVIGGLIGVASGAISALIIRHLRKKDSLRENVI